MTAIDVLFLQGGGEGAHEEDALLADSLKRALGPGYKVNFPRMPREDDPDVGRWKQKISSELSAIGGPAILVAHSIGGSILLRYLAEEQPDVPITGVFLLAAPSWDENRWNYDDLKLPGDVVARLAGIPHLCFYHCRDDEIVPFAHLALHHARVPQATIRPLDSGGHQFGNDLRDIAVDIRRIVAS